MNNLEKKAGFIENIKKTVRYIYRLVSLEIPAYIVQGLPVPKKIEIDSISPKNKVVYSPPFSTTPSR